MYNLAAPILFLIGLAGVVVILVRAMPALSSISESESTKLGFALGDKIRAIIARIPWQKWLFRSIERSLSVIRKAMFAGLKRSERLAHSVQARSRRLTPEEGAELLPKFFERITKRRAYLEEERKLIEYLAHHPDDMVSLRRLGTLYMLSGNKKDARAAFEQMVRLVPDDEIALQKLEDLQEKG